MYLPIFSIFLHYTMIYAVTFIDLHIQQELRSFTNRNSNAKKLFSS